MIIRIVKMTFKQESTQDFEHLFEQYKEHIARAEGCISLKLIKQHHSPVFFTISEWEHEKYLELYRQSELFNTVWASTKVLFGAKPEAWTTEILFNSSVKR